MATAIRRWDELDPETRAALDEIFVAEFEGLAEPGVPPSAMATYLAYRHERPAGQITTVEQGVIRRMLHRMRDPGRLVDPVDDEVHVEPIERFGARRLHLTHTATYLAILFVHVYVGLLALLFWILLR